MTLAVRSDDMEHVKSTIVTTALLVTGLISAAHVLHPRDPDSEMRRAKPVVATIDAATAWSDPPARASQVVQTGMDARTPRPASFTLLPVAMAASLLATEGQGLLRQTRKAEPVRGNKFGQLGTRSRSASIGQGARAELKSSNPVATAGPSGKAAQGDPIGDLLKALGIGRDSEG